ncbi:MAG: TIGR00304 family protein [Methanobacteriaceae archaeon]|nr:TIGR00304 family protein [Methanobacteriaceae archaeon]
MINGNTLVSIGIFIVIAGFFLIFIGSILQTAISDNSDENSTKSEIKTGGVILIGPIPIIFGNDKNMLVTGVIMAIILMAIAYFLFYRH